MIFNSKHITLVSLHCIIQNIILAGLHLNFVIVFVFQGFKGFQFFHINIQKKIF